MQIYLKPWRNGKAQLWDYDANGGLKTLVAADGGSGSLGLLRMSLIYSFHRGAARGPGERGLINLKYLCNLRIVGLEQFLY